MTNGQEAHIVGKERKKTMERPDNPRILIASEQIRSRVKELGEEIGTVYHGVHLTAICVLKGSFIFFSDLIRHIPLPLRCDFLGLSSYENHPEGMHLSLDLSVPITGEHVLLIEDLVDSGSTLYFLHQILQARSPASLRSCSLLAKPAAKKISLDFVGFHIGEEFAVGYGMDRSGRYCGLPYIGAVERPS